MILRRRRPHAFEHDGDRTAIRLGDDERSMLANLAGQFRAVVADDADPDLRRLYPTAYPDDLDPLMADNIAIGITGCALQHYAGLLINNLILARCD